MVNKWIIAQAVEYSLFALMWNMEAGRQDHTVTMVTVGRDPAGERCPIPQQSLITVITSDSITLINYRPPAVPLVCGRQRWQQLAALSAAGV